MLGIQKERHMSFALYFSFSRFNPIICWNTSCNDFVRKVRRDFSLKSASFLINSLAGNFNDKN